MSQPRKITIVGGGQSGLQLGCDLLGRGFSVEIVQNRTGEQIASGRPMSSQCMFDNSLQIERDLGLAFWDDAEPVVESISFTVAAPDGSGVKAIDWNGKLDRPARSVDQRVKVPVWMKEFERRGGQITIAEAGVPEIEACARSSDLVIVAAGKGEIAQLFERDAAHSPYAKPQRALSLIYVHGMTPRPEHSAVCFNVVPGVGEYFVFPALTKSGPCEIMGFVGLPGGPMDCWSDLPSSADVLAKGKALLETYVPWEAAR